MTRSNLNAFLVLSLGLMLPRISHAAQSYDNCTGFITTIPTVITTQGTWCLKQDLNTALTAVNAITINNNNVIIDCNDFKLGGLQAGVGTTSVGIYALNRFNATVRNCNIRGFIKGVSFEGSSGGGHVVEDNRFDSNTYAGVWVEGDGSSVRRNRVYGSGGTTVTTGVYQFSTYGIHTDFNVDAIDNTVSGVTATTGSGRSVFGIHANNNGNGSLLGNRVRNLKADGAGTVAGIWTSSAVNGRVTLRNNDVADNASTGGVGLHCNSFGHALDNISNGFATGIDTCNNDGGNVVVP